MDDFFADEVLQTLPDADLSAVDAVFTAPCVLTPIEEYINDIIEPLDDTETSFDADTFDWLPLMAAIQKAQAEHSSASVSWRALHSALDSLEQMKNCKRMAQQLRRRMRPLMRFLNGPGATFIPQVIVREAVAREDAVASLERGWGISEPPQYATVHRILLSCGVPEDLLPKYKPLPWGVFVPLQSAWQAACAHFHWAYVVPTPDADFEQLRRAEPP